MKKKTQASQEISQKQIRARRWGIEFLTGCGLTGVISTIILAVFTNVGIFIAVVGGSMIAVLGGLLMTFFGRLFWLACGVDWEQRLRVKK